MISDAQCNARELRVNIELPYGAITTENNTMRAMGSITGISKAVSFPQIGLFEKPSIPQLTFFDSDSFINYTSLPF